MLLRLFSFCYLVLVFFFLLIAILFRFITFLEIFNNSWIFFRFSFGKFSAIFQILFLVHFNSFFFVRFQLEACRPVTISHKSLILYCAFFIFLSFFALFRIFSSEPFSSSLNLYSGKSNPFLNQFLSYWVQFFVCFSFYF